VVFTFKKREGIMTLSKKTVIDHIEISRDAAIQVRFALLILEDGEEISSAWHRTSIPPGTDPMQQMAAVNAHLKQMNKDTVKDTSLLEQVCALVHTQEVKARYAEQQKKSMLQIAGN
jgi:hypothetical protein